MTEEPGGSQVPGASKGPQRLFADIDRALVMAALAEKLRAAGVTVPLRSTVIAAESLDHVGALSLDDLYWLTRLSFVGSRREIDVFDELFDAVFDTDHRNRDQGRGRRPARANTEGAPRPGDRLHSVPLAAEGETVDAGGLPWATLPNVAADNDDDGADDGPTLVERLPSLGSAEDAKPFDLLDEAELIRVGELIEASMTSWPRRRSRRRRLSPGGDRVQMRAGLRRALRTGGEPVILPRSVRVERRRPVAVFLDVSGSMESFARAYLHVARPLASAGRAEVFAFATRVTRVTPSLRLRSTAEAVAAASDDVADRFGGTRLASSLRTASAHRTWSSLLRGSVVLIVSDGWDTDPPDELDRVMGRLARMAERIVWVNPRLAADDYEPAVGGMAAALPHCDHFLPGHSLSAMEDVLAALEAGT